MIKWYWRYSKDGLQSLSLLVGLLHLHLSVHCHNWTQTLFCVYVYTDSPL